MKHEVTLKYRKALLNQKVQQVIIDTLKEFKERDDIEVSRVGFDRNHIHILCRFFTKILRRAGNKNDQKHNRAADIFKGAWSQERIVGRRILDRWVLYSDDKWQRQ